jgi:hypothetical protein
LPFARHTGAVSTSTERMRNLRARRRALLEPVPDAETRPPELQDAVESSIAALQLRPADMGLAHLAVTYARTIDQAQDPAAAARHVGPLLQRALESLGATPSTRHAAPKPAAPQRPNPIREMRKAHLAAAAKRSGTA